MIPPRRLTPTELATVYPKYCCLFCAFDVLIPGPRGGIMQNMTCPRCGGRFNLVSREYLRSVPKGSWPDVPPFGELISEPTIPEHDRLPALGDVLAYYRKLHGGNA